MKKLHNFINGEFVGPVSELYSVNTNPATGEIYSKLPDSQKEDINKAVKAATEAFPFWSQKSPAERANYLYKIADGIEARKEALAKAESIDQGKTYGQALNIEIPRVAQNFRYFAGLIQHTEEKSFQQTENSFHYTTRKPVGVCGLISPWNLPLYLLTWKIAPALAMGNTAICKPSELTPMTAYLLCEIFHEVGLPPGVCNMVFGTGKNAGNALVSHPDVPLISFTGGTRTGTAISQAAAPFQKKVSLELGGKNPAIIFADADYEKALNTTVRSSFANQGEICLCTSRIYVEESLYPKFLNDFVEKTQSIKVGDPLAPHSQMGAIVSQQHLEKIESS